MLFIYSEDDKVNDFQAIKDLIDFHRKKKNDVTSVFIKNSVHVRHLQIHPDLVNIFF
jgi:hypothetical protein